MKWKDPIKIKSDFENELSKREDEKIKYEQTISKYNQQNQVINIIEQKKTEEKQSAINVNKQNNTFIELKVSSQNNPMSQNNNVVKTKLDEIFDLIEKL